MSTLAKYPTKFQTYTNGSTAEKILSYWGNLRFNSITMNRLNFILILNKNDFQYSVTVCELVAKDRELLWRTKPSHKRVFSSKIGALACAAALAKDYNCGYSKFPGDGPCAASHDLELLAQFTLRGMA